MCNDFYNEDNMIFELAYVHTENRHGHKMI